MKNIKRPGLPATTPFSTDCISSVSSAPWHTRHASLLTTPSSISSSASISPTHRTSRAPGESGFGASGVSSGDVDDKTHISLGSSLTKLTSQSKKSMRFNPHQEWEREPGGTGRGGRGEGGETMSDAGTFFSIDDSSMLRNNKGPQLDVLLSELSRRTEIAEGIFESTLLAQARMKTIDKNITQLKEECTEKDRINASRQRSVGKLVSINMMLIETLDALGLQPSSDKGLSKLMIRLRSDILPSIKPESEGANSLVKTTNDDIHAVNAKLKEGLLIMSREYYGSKKSMKSVFGVYEELRSALRVIDQKNRTLQHDLDEIRKDDESNITKKRLSAHQPSAPSSGDYVGGDPEGERAQQILFNDNVKSLIERHSIDAVDSVKLLRRFFSLVANAPSNLDIRSIATHIVSKELCDTLEVAMICLFLEVPNKPGYMMKYTPRSPKPEVVDTSPHCLVGEVMKLGLPVRLNNLEEFAYDPIIDGISGLKVLRVFSVPLKCRVTGRVFGALNFINKHENDIFTNGDELFIKILAGQMETILSSCHMFARVTTKADLLSSLLRASTDFASTIPSEGTLVANRPVLIGELLHALETIAKDALKCYKVRAFIVSSPFIGLETDSLLYLKHSTCAGLTRYSSTLEIVQVAGSAGIAGKVSKTQNWNQSLRTPPEELNLNADLDPASSPMITFPVCLPGGHEELGYNNSTVAVLQLVLGPQSPRMTTLDDDDEMSLTASALWLIHLISPSLFTLLHSVSKNPLLVVAPAFVRAPFADDFDPDRPFTPESSPAKTRRTSMIHEFHHALDSMSDTGTPGERSKGLFSPFNSGPNTPYMSNDGTFSPLPQSAVTLIPLGGTSSGGLGSRRGSKGTHAGLLNGPRRGSKGGLLAEQDIISALQSEIDHSTLSAQSSHSPHTAQSSQAAKSALHSLQIDSKSESPLLKDLSSPPHQNDPLNPLHPLHHLHSPHNDPLNDLKLNDHYDSLNESPKDSKDSSEKDLIDNPIDNPKVPSALPSPLRNSASIKAQLNEPSFGAPSPLKKSGSFNRKLQIEKSFPAPMQKEGSFKAPLEKEGSFKAPILQKEGSFKAPTLQKEGSFKAPMLQKGMSAKGALFEIFTPMALRDPSQMSPHYVDMEEHESLKRHIAALQKSNRKLRQPVAVTSKVFSAKALFDNNNIEKRLRAPPVVTKVDNNFAMFQIDEATREVIDVKEQLRKAMIALETAERIVKEQDWAVNETYQVVEDTTESEEQLRERIKEHEETIERILELTDTSEELQDLLESAREEARHYLQLSNNMQEAEVRAEKVIQEEKSERKRAAKLARIRGDDAASVRRISTKLNASDDGMRELLMMATQQELARELEELKKIRMDEEALEGLIEGERNRVHELQSKIKEVRREMAKLSNEKRAKASQDHTAITSRTTSRSASRNHSRSGSFDGLNSTGLGSNFHSTPSYTPVETPFVSTNSGIPTPVLSYSHSGVNFEVNSGVCSGGNSGIPTPALSGVYSGVNEAYPGVYSGGNSGIPTPALSGVYAGVNEAYPGVYSGANSGANSYSNSANQSEKSAEKASVDKSWREVEEKLERSLQIAGGGNKNGTHTSLDLSPKQEKKTRCKITMAIEAAVMHINSLQTELPFERSSQVSSASVSPRSYRIHTALTGSRTPSRLGSEKSEKNENENNENNDKHEKHKKNEKRVITEIYGNSEISEKSETSALTSFRSVLPYEKPNYEKSRMSSGNVSPRSYRIQTALTASGSPSQVNSEKSEISELPSPRSYRRG